VEYRGRILGRFPEKSLECFPPCYSQSLLLFCLRFLFLQIHATSYTVSRVPLLCTIKEKGGILDRKQYSLLYGLRNPYRNLKSENSQDYAQKPQRNCTFMNSASGHQKDHQINASCTNCTRALNITSAPQSRDTSFRDASSRRPK
jgi:hypothetical protein